MPNLIFKHENNLISKINDNYKGKKNRFKKFKEEVYNPFKENQLKIKKISKSAIEKKIQLLSDYYENIKQFNRDGWITSQSKFRSTVLEEFCNYLFKDIPELEKSGLSFFNRGIYTGLSIDHMGKVTPSKKNVDFCIAKEIVAKFGDDCIDIIVPQIAIECKTYIDKTMFGEAQFIASKIKQGSPTTKVYVIAEENQIAKKEIPSKGQTPIDQIYIIRDEQTNDIISDVVWRLLKEVHEAIQSIDKERKYLENGKLLR